LHGFREQYARPIAHASLHAKELDLFKCLVFLYRTCKDYALCIASVVTRKNQCEALERRTVLDVLRQGLQQLLRELVGLELKLKMLWTRAQDADIGTVGGRVFE
jgi:hypothetical protein